MWDIPDFQTREFDRSAKRAATRVDSYRGRIPPSLLEVTHFDYDKKQTLEWQDRNAEN
jgi:hypothetical protein